MTATGAGAYTQGVDDSICDVEGHGRKPFEDHTVRQLIEHVLDGQRQQAKRENKIMTDISVLQSTIDGIVAGEATENAAVSAAFADLLTEIAGLQAGAITQAQIDGLVAAAQPVVAALSATQAAATAADPGAPAPTPTPAP